MDCIFCKIVAGELPCYKVYEDSQFLGFLDINPSSFGHSLLIPKKHYRWVYDVPNFGEFFEVAKKVALTLKSTLNVDYVSFLTLGELVQHAHIHIIPQKKSEEPIRWGQKQEVSSEKMEEISRKILQNVVK